MDGRLQIFEQDSHSFTRQLENSLIPGPLCYCEKMDAFITCSSSMCIEAYKYKQIAAAMGSSGAKQQQSQMDPGSLGQEEEPSKASGSQNYKSQKKVAVEWSVNIGEHATDIFVSRHSHDLPSFGIELVIVGETSIFVLQQQGNIKFQKRLEAPASCCVPVRTGEINNQETPENLLVATYSEHFLIFNNAKVVWGARTSIVPVDLKIERFGGTPGYIVALSDEGKLIVHYLGTDPPSTTVGALESKDLNYEEMDEEHRRLLSVIRESQSENGRSEPRTKILLRAQVPSLLDVTREDSAVEIPEMLGDTLRGRKLALNPDGTVMQLTVRLFVSYTGMDSLSDVNINITTPPHIIARDNSISIPTVNGGNATPLIIPITLYSTTNITPTSLTANVAAAYSLENGEPRTSYTAVQLPLCLGAKLIPPVKNTTFKFTLDTNRMPPLLAELFEDMIGQPGQPEDYAQLVTSQSSNVLSFMYVNGFDVTVLGSRSAGRYRIQSGSLDALWLISDQLIRRLSGYFEKVDAEGGGAGEEPFMVAYQEPLPLADFFQCIDDHFACRKQLEESHDVLNNRAHQYRTIQKRLLVRFKDRNPAPLNHLDWLIQGTHSQLIDIGNTIEGLGEDLIVSSNRLSCATHLMLMLIRYRFGLDDESFEVLRAHLSPDVEDNQDQGWEELTDAGMTHLLRTVLAKSNRDSAVIPPPLSMPSDTTKLRKHITLVCDRLGKGAVLVQRPQSLVVDTRPHSRDGEESKGEESKGEESKN
jgi:Bardet-Biedl syndrome 9 protein